MKAKTKELISNIIGCLAIVACLYVAYFVMVTVVCLDGTPTGTLYEDLGMVQLRHYVAQFIKLAFNLLAK